MEPLSLSARRAWIEIIKFVNLLVLDGSLSARRAWIEITQCKLKLSKCTVALRKESVDRNLNRRFRAIQHQKSLSARRAWIEMVCCPRCIVENMVSLSARRAWIEILSSGINPDQSGSLSARRAWIEIGIVQLVALAFEVALRKESVDRNSF